MATFRHFRGPVPFYPPSLFGPPSLSIRMQNTDWSDSIDIQSERMSAGLGRYISLRELLPLANRKTCTRYEVGVHASKGQGLLAQVAMVTFVPRYIIVSKLPREVEIRQVRVDIQYEHIQLISILLLLRRTHHNKPRAFSIRMRAQHFIGLGKIAHK
jgi:hypothetical protein